MKSALGLLQMSVFEIPSVETKWVNINGFNLDNFIDFLLNCNEKTTDT